MICAILRCHISGPARTAPYDGKCGPTGTAYLNWTEAAEQVADGASCDRAGTAVSDSLCGMRGDRSGRFEMKQVIRLKAFRVNHNVLCYGYALEIDRAGKFDPERAKAEQIPQMYWKHLQIGETVEYEGRILTPDLVLGPPRKGIKLTYTTDTRPTDSIRENAKGSDLFICEGMYGEKEKIAKAREYKHDILRGGAACERRAGKRNVADALQPSLTRAEEYMDDVRKIFPAAKAGKDKMSAELNFE